MTKTENTLFDQELHRRLKILESPDYSDPARDDLPLIDILALCLGIAIINVVGFGLLY